jgi:microcin C transport system ATP-binding protein
MAKTTLLSVKNLSTSFREAGKKDIQAVKNISFDIQEGKTLALVGESGSGKSVSSLSLLRLLPYPKAYHPSGRVLFEGKDLLSLPEAELRHVRGNKISMIFQEPLTALNPLHTVEQQIKEVLDLHTTLTPIGKKTRIVELLNSVGFPDGIHRLKAYPHELSGGQRQRVMIAMALAAGPKLLIADEPTTALDVTTQLQILTLLKSLQEEYNLSLLFITHDLNIVKHIADRVAVMYQGEIVEQTTTAQLFKAPQHPYTQALIAAEPQGTALPLPKKNPEIMRADNISVHFPLKTSFFSRKKRVFKAVDRVSLSLKQGETVGIVGESGSGKTRLAMALLRLQEIQSGTIHLQGHELASLSGRQMRPYRKDIQLVFQDPFGSLSPRLSITEIIGEGLGVHNLAKSPAEKEALIIQALEEVQLDPQTRFRYPHEFSGGQRQRIAIARTLVLKPKILVLDEPTSALDRAVQVSIIALLRDLQARHGLSYLFISHDLKVVKALAHRVLVMKEGRIVEQGPTEDIFKNPEHPYTKTLIEAAFV